MVNGCLNDHLFLNLSCWGNTQLVSLALIFISFEQEHFVPIDVLLFNWSQLFSLLIFPAFLKCKDFVESDIFCLFLPFLPLPHASPQCHVCSPAVCRGGLLLSCFEHILVLGLKKITFFCSVYVLVVRKGGPQENSFLFYCELDVTKNIFSLISAAHALAISPEEIQHKVSI